MEKLVNIISTNRGTVKIEFIKENIFQILRNEFGYRYTKINNKGFYLQLENNDEYKVVSFDFIKQDFLNFIRNNYNEIIEGSNVSYVDFMDSYHKQNPLKKGLSCRPFLSSGFVLKQNNIHSILMNIDLKYKNNYDNKEFDTFLQKEKFIEDIDSHGNFSEKHPLFYKRKSKNEFIIFNQITKGDGEHLFDLWLVNAITEKEFLKKKLNTNQQKSIKLAFNLREDIGLYTGLNQ